MTATMMASSEQPQPPPQASNSSGNDILASKVSRALEVRTDTVAMKAALDALSQLSQNVLDSRSVRVAIEQDALHQALLMQEELAKILHVVKDLRQQVADTAEIANQVSATINGSVIIDQQGEDEQHALEQEQELASKLSDAFRERDDAVKRSKAVNEFFNKFDLSEQDSILLDSYNFEDLDQGMAFLDALERVRKIRVELGKAFGTQQKSEKSSDTQRLGATSAIRMMESLAVKQERAYERLYHWLQQYLNLNASAQDGDEALSHPLVRQSLYTLRHVPAFYSHTLELIATSRRSEETRRFLLALSAGYDGLPPIEMKAHDPVTYVGDMLAHVFRAFSIEADVAKGICIPQEDNEQVEESSVPDSVVELDKPMTATDILAHAMSGVSRPLKSRITQVIASLARRPDEQDNEDDEEQEETLDGVEQEGTVARTRISSLYSICGLLLFYQSALIKAVHKLESATTTTTSSSSSATNEEELLQSSPVIVCIMECLEEASTAYAASLKVYGAMLESLSMLSGESEAQLAHSMMADICNVRMESPGFSVDVQCPPKIASCTSLSFLCETLIVEGALAFCKTLNDTVPLKASVELAQTAGLLEDVTRFMNLIGEKEQELINDLVQKETKQVLNVCGLGAVVAAFEKMDPNMPMATQLGLTAEDMESSFKEFYSSLYSPPLPSYDQVQNVALRKQARTKIAENVADIYKTLYETMMSEQGGYEDTSFVGHTPSQVRTLFTV